MSFSSKPSSKEVPLPQTPEDNPFPKLRPVPNRMKSRSMIGAAPPAAASPATPSKTAQPPPSQVKSPEASLPKSPPIPKSPAVHAFQKNPPVPKSPAVRAVQKNPAVPRSPAAQELLPEAALKDKEPTTPLTPAIKRVIPTIKMSREEPEVLSPEERRKLARLAAEKEADKPRIIPQIELSREEPDVLSPEERRKLAREAEPVARVSANIALSRDEPDVLSPEERRRLARENQPAYTDSEASGMGSRKQSADAPVSVSRKGSAQSNQLGGTYKSVHSTPSARKERSPMPTPGQASLPPKSPLVPQAYETDPLLRQQLVEAERRVATLEEELDAARSEIQQQARRINELEAAKAQEPKQSKKHKEEISKKDKHIKRLEQDLREVEKKLVQASIVNKSSGQSNGASAAVEQLRDLLQKKENEVSQLQSQLDAATLIHQPASEEDDSTLADGSQVVVLLQQAEEEVQMLSSQIWSLEMAIEFRTAEIGRQQKLLSDFVAQVSQLDHELAEAMRTIIRQNSEKSKSEEMAVLGKSIEETMADLKGQRDEAKKTKKKRKPRKGRLARENAELKEENDELRYEIIEMKRAMAQGNPQMFINAYQKAQAAQARAGGGQFVIPSLEGPTAGQGQLSSRPEFIAAFIAAGQAEAQLEQFRSTLKYKDDKINRLQQKLDASRKAIVSSAGIGYENEVKLQQARKALQCALDSEEVVLTGQPSPKGAGVNKASAGTAAGIHTNTDARSPAHGVPQNRSVSPVRDPNADSSVARRAMAWIHANPHHAPADVPNYGAGPRRPSSAVWEEPRP